MSASSEAIWKKPAWITAIVGLISVFLTVPEIIGNYLTKQQDIEIAKEKTKALKIENTESKQDQEFKIVNSTLAQQGTERVFVLRYLAATVDDPSAKAWAVAEVKRLDDLASGQEKLSKAQQELERKEKELQILISKGDTDTQKLEAEVETLQASLDLKNSELAELRQKAGLGDQRMPGELFLITITFDWSLDKTKPGATISLLHERNRIIYGCGRDTKQCDREWEGSAPVSIDIDYGAIFKSVRVVTLAPTRGPAIARSIVPYSCAAKEEKIVCRQKDIYKEGGKGDRKILSLVGEGKISPERAQHTSPGQRPGKQWTKDEP